MDKVKVKETSKEYEVSKEDLVPASPEEEKTWYNQTAGILDRFRLMLCADIYKPSAFKIEANLVLLDT